MIRIKCARADHMRYDHYVMLWEMYLVCEVQSGTIIAFEGSG